MIKMIAHSGVASVLVLSSWSGIVGAERAVAQVVTNHDKWRTVRTADQCVTMRSAGNIYEPITMHITGKGGLEFVLVSAKRNKYPDLARAANRSVKLDARIGSGNEIIHRFETTAIVYLHADQVQLIFEADLFPYLAQGDALQIPNKRDISQNLIVSYRNFSQALNDFRECESIRLGRTHSSQQSQDVPLSELEPFERAKKVCEQEMEQTGGLVAADNPYKLDGYTYPNACEAAIDHAQRRARRFQKVE